MPFPSPPEKNVPSMVLVSLFETTKILCLRGFTPLLPAEFHHRIYSCHRSFPWKSVGFNVRDFFFPFGIILNHARKVHDALAKRDRSQLNICKDPALFSIQTIKRCLPETWTDTIYLRLLEDGFVQVRMVVKWTFIAHTKDRIWLKHNPSLETWQMKLKRTRWQY